MEMEDREEAISFSDNYDDYIPNSASDDSGSDDESVQFICVPMLSGSALPYENETVSNTTDVSAGNAIVETTADVNSSKDGNNISRITRPCVSCGMYQSQLLRHLKRKHANEEAVKVALGLPQQDQRQAFDRIRKLGMFEKNVQLQKEGGILIRERRQGKEDNLTVCNGCKTFFNSKQIWGHKQNCLDIKGYSVGSFTFSNYIVSAQELAVTEYFKNDILDCFRQDEVDGICRTDKMVIMIGQMLWAKKEKHVIMSDMRLLANIIVTMRRIKQDDTLDGK